MNEATTMADGTNTDEPFGGRQARPIGRRSRWAAAATEGLREHRGSEGLARGEAAPQGHAPGARQQAVRGGLLEESRRARPASVGTGCSRMRTIGLSRIPAGMRAKEGPQPGIGRKATPEGTGGSESPVAEPSDGTVPSVAKVTDR